LSYQLINEHDDDDDDDDDCEWTANKTWTWFPWITDYRDADDDKSSDTVGRHYEMRPAK